ncbi:hypothetical protein LTR10_008939 [Elasticomyces elasticus]|nr:hypothetical protein LTR10_008939 [Elasticomyces elasticus]
MANAIGMDDYTLVASMLLAIALTVSFQMEVHYGMGLHTAEVKSADTKVLAMTVSMLDSICYAGTD